MKHFIWTILNRKKVQRLKETLEVGHEVSLNGATWRVVSTCEEWATLETDVERMLFGVKIIATHGGDITWCRLCHYGRVLPTAGESVEEAMKAKVGMI